MSAAAGPAIGWLVIGLAAGALARRAAERDRARVADGSKTALAAGPVAWNGRGVEAATALLLGALAAGSSWGWPAVPYVGVVTTVAAVTITDLRHFRVPDRIVAGGLLATTLAMGIVGAATGRLDRLAAAAVGAGLFAGLLLAVRLAVPQGLGRGDVKLGVLLGAAIGWSARPGIDVLLAVLWALIAACGLGLTAAAALRATARRRPRRATTTPQIPFAPALSLATVAVVLAAGPLQR